MPNKGLAIVLNWTKISYKCNFNSSEITVTVLNIHVIGIYCSKTKVTISQLIDALTHLHNLVLLEPTDPTIPLVDFNIYLVQANTEQKALD